MKNILRYLIVSISLLLTGLGSQFAWSQSSELSEIQQWILKKHPDVDHINNTSLQDKLKNDNDDLVIFDVRETSEFTVSHLENSIRVDPDIRRDEFLALFGDQLKGKTAVFYCSVGRRSSLLAERVGADLEDMGTAEILNLEHGIFGWHNQDLPLMSENTDTDYVHAYSRKWGRLIERKELIRYQLE